AKARRSSQLPRATMSPRRSSKAGMPASSPRSPRASACGWLAMRGRCVRRSPSMAGRSRRPPQVRWRAAAAARSGPPPGPWATPSAAPTTPRRPDASRKQNRRHFRVACFGGHRSPATAMRREAYSFFAFLAFFLAGLRLAAFFFVAFFFVAFLAFFLAGLRLAAFFFAALFFAGFLFAALRFFGAAFFFAAFFFAAFFGAAFFALRFFAFFFGAAGAAGDAMVIMSAIIFSSPV